MSVGFGANGVSGAQSSTTPYKIVTIAHAGGIGRLHDRGDIPAASRCHRYLLSRLWDPKLKGSNAAIRVIRGVLKRQVPSPSIRRTN